MKNNQLLFVKILSMSKEDTSYFYFHFESNDGVGFYSTLSQAGVDYFLQQMVKCTNISDKKHQTKTIDKKTPQERFIILHFHPSLEQECHKVLESLKNQIKFQYHFEDQVIDDKHYHDLISQVISMDS